MSAEIQAAEARLAKGQAGVERLRARLADEQPAAEALTVTAAVYAPFALPRLDEVPRALSDALLVVLDLGVVHRRCAGAVLRADPRGRPAAGAGHDLPQLVGRRAAAR